MNVLFVMLGGFLGAILRYVLGDLPSPNGFPMGTFTVNLVGCFLLGWLLSLIATHKNSNLKLSLFLGTGFIGSFTTFSTFSIEILLLMNEGKFGLALLYVAASLLAGITLSYIGYRLAYLRKSGERY